MAKRSFEVLRYLGVRSKHLREVRFVRFPLYVYGYGGDQLSVVLLYEDARGDKERFDPDDPIPDPVRGSAVEWVLAAQSSAAGGRVSSQ